jgi:hypothetical protein
MNYIWLFSGPSPNGAYYGGFQCVPNSKRHIQMTFGSLRLPAFTTLPFSQTTILSIVGYTYKQILFNEIRISDGQRTLHFLIPNNDNFLCSGYDFQNAQHSCTISETTINCITIVDT